MNMAPHASDNERIARAELSGELLHSFRRYGLAVLADIGFDPQDRRTVREIGMQRGFATTEQAINYIADECLAGRNLEYAGLVRRVTAHCPMDASI